MNPPWLTDACCVASPPPIKPPRALYRSGISGVHEGGGGFSLGGGFYYAQMVSLPPVVLPVTRPIVCRSQYGRYCVAEPCL